jgi:hypothetical protein|tara:strand:- start:258 stop:1202 length:945 start_codon:yes stop_codon:yes gene_type:complete
MAYNYLGLVNDVNRRLNEVELTSSNFDSAIGEYAMVKDAINSSIRYINQHEFGFPFNHDTETKTLTPGVVRYSIPTDAKSVDYSTARIKKDTDLNSLGNSLDILDYKEYISRDYANQEDDIVSTTVNASSGLSASVTTITVASTTDFSSTGTLHIGGEQITYTGISGNDFTGCTRGANSTTAAAIANSTTVTQFSEGESPRAIVRTPDNNYLLYPYPDKQYVLQFDYFKLPTDLSSATDVPSLPVQFRYVIVDGAMYTSYMFRGETQEALVLKEAFEDGIKHMRTLYINRYDYIRSSVVNVRTLNTKMLPSRVL